MTSDSKAHKRFPQIDDEMVGRGVNATHGVWAAGVGGCLSSPLKPRVVRAILEAALDRRVGPKCRRKEWDDVCSIGRRMAECGRRKDDQWFRNLPRKSARLAREAAEKEEIEVSEGMMNAASAALAPHVWHSFDPTRTFDSAQQHKQSLDGKDFAKAMQAVYRAMERVRREEQKSKEPVYYADVLWGPRGAAPYGAKGETRQSPRDGKWFHRRSGDPGMPWPFFMGHRRASDPK